MTTPKQPLGIFVTIVIGLALVLHACWYFSLHVDDAFILLRYATQMAHGNGWVFNAGDRVEGFHGQMLLFLEAALLNFDVDGLWWAKAFGLLSAVLTLLATVRLARLLEDATSSWVLSGVLLALSVPVAVGTVNGLETMPFTACVAWGLVLALEEETNWRALAGLLLGLATMFRPEGAIAFACALAYCVAVRRWIAVTVVWTVIVVPLTIWRYVYFGALWSNAYVAHVAPDAVNRWDSGIDYLERFGLTPVVVVGIGALILLALPTVRARLFALFAVVWCVYITASTGDAVPRARLFVPLMPFLAAGVGAGLTRLGLWLFRNQKDPKQWTAGLAVVFVLVCLPGTWADARQTHVEIEAHNKGIVAARAKLTGWLHETTQSLDVLVANVPGQLAFQSHLPTIDTAGATDRSIADALHSSVGQYQDYVLVPDPGTAATIAHDVLDRHPELIVAELNGPAPVFGGDHPKPMKSTSKQDLAIVQSTAFKKGYDYVCNVPSEVALGEQYVLNLFVRKGYKPRIPPHILLDGTPICEMPGDSEGGLTAMNQK